MLNNKTLKVILLIYLIVLPYSLSGKISTSYREVRTKNLEDILDKCAVYCEKLANASLFFVCTERVEETRYKHYFPRFAYSRDPFAKKVEDNKYIYDYQLIKKGNRIEEKRILLEENGKKKNEKNAQLKTRMFYSKRSVFGPVGLLARKNHDKYNYEVVDEESVHEREAVVIEATPKSEMRDMPNYGKIWVDREDYSILKIEVAEESLVGFKQVKETSKFKSTPMISVTHYYAEVYKTDKDQVIRFPSQTVFLCEKYLYKRGYKIKVIAAKTQYIYDNYKFFTVDVDVKY
jgi:hypothetical protein